MSSSEPLILQICLDPNPVFQLGLIPMPIFEDIQKCFVKVTSFDWRDSSCLEQGIIGNIRGLEINILCQNHNFF